MKFWLLRVNRNLRLTPDISVLNAARGSSSLGAGTRRVGLCGEGDLAEKKGPPDLLIHSPASVRKRTANLQSIGK